MGTKLHISYSRDSGGAAKAAWSVYLKDVKRNKDTAFWAIDENRIYYKEGCFKVYKFDWTFKSMLKLCRGIDRYMSYVLSNSKFPRMSFTLWGLANLNRVDSLDIDELHLHWINRMSFNYNSILLDSKVTITPHDLWYFTGGCHYIHECVGYKSNCLECPVSRSRLSRKIVASQLNRKKDFLEHCRVTAVPSSSWVRSFLVDLADPYLTIENVEKFSYLPANVYHKTKKVYDIVIGGANIFSDDRKGGALIIQVLELVKASMSEVRVCYFGNDKLPPELKWVENLGWITNENRIQGIYKQSKLYLSLSTQETYGLMVEEALAYGCFVVAWENVGVINDLNHSSLYRIEQGECSNSSAVILSLLRNRTDID